MSLRATIHKADLSVADIDRGYYGDHALTIARHPSETEQRMMIRLLAFALFADAALVFGRGLSTDDEPDLLRNDATGACEHWIDVGWPDERRLRRACARASRVSVLTYGGSKADIWWSQNVGALRRLANLEVFALPPEAADFLSGLAQRSMRLNVTVQDAQVSIGSESAHAVFELPVFKALA